VLERLLLLRLLLHRACFLTRYWIHVDSRTAFYPTFIIRFRGAVKRDFSWFRAFNWLCRLFYLLAPLTNLSVVLLTFTAKELSTVLFFFHFFHRINSTSRFYNPFRAAFIYKFKGEFIKNLFKLSKLFNNSSLCLLKATKSVTITFYVLLELIKLILIDFLDNSCTFLFQIVNFLVSQSFKLLKAVICH